MGGMGGIVEKAGTGMDGGGGGEAGSKGGSNKYWGGKGAGSSWDFFPIPISPFPYASELIPISVRAKGQCSVYSVNHVILMCNLVL